MPNVNTLYPSNYLKAADLAGKTARVIVAHVTIEKIGNDPKPVLYFQGKTKGVVLNKTNGMTIAAVYGPDTENWTGGELELFSAFVDFQGKQTEAIRVRVPPRKPAGQAAPVSPGGNFAPNARDDVRMRQAAPPPAQDDGAFDDAIPF